MKKINCIRSLVILLFCICTSGCNSNNSGSNASLNSDSCTLSQPITAQDPDGNTTDISDIVEAQTGQTSTDCPSSLLNTETIAGATGAIAITQTSSGAETYLIINLDDISPFTTSIDPLSGNRTSTDFITTSPARADSEEKICKINLTLGGTIDSSNGKIEGTLHATVFNVSICAAE